MCQTAKTPCPSLVLEKEQTLELELGGDVKRNLDPPPSFSRPKSLKANTESPDWPWHFHLTPFHLLCAFMVDTLQRLPQSRNAHIRAWRRGQGSGPYPPTLWKWGVWERKTSICVQLLIGAYRLFRANLGNITHCDPTDIPGSVSVSTEPHASRFPPRAVRTRTKKAIVSAERPLAKTWTLPAQHCRH